MSFPKYPAYKDSGVEWIGEIPVGWKIEKFRYIFFESKEKIETEKDISGDMLSVSGYRGVEIKKYDDENKKRLSYELIGYRIVRKRQLVINTMWLNFSGLGVSWLNGYVSPAYRCYSVNENIIDINYTNYLLRSSVYVLGYSKYLQGIRPNSLQMSREDLMPFPIILPSLPEQQAIASFLDHECGKIDTLIAEQERLIALLAEKLQAVISLAVTKGLNPNVPMKDSGIPWIGMVPEGWTLKPLKSFVNFVGGATPTKDNLLFWNGDIPWVSPKDIKSYHIFDTEDHITEAALSASATRLVPTGNVLIVVRSGILQRTIPVAINSIPVTLNQDMKCIIPQKEICMPDFLFWLIYGFSRELLPIWSKQGATVESLEMQYMQKTLIPLPTIPEQKEIIRFMQHQFRNFNNLIVSSSTAIALLKERRAALISAAVTGKIDVRAQSKAIAA